MLVLMFRRYRSKWAQHTAVYAMSGVASSNVIQNIAVKAIKALKKKGAIVNNIFCDGHHPYKGVQRLFGVSGEMEHVTHFIKHPTDSNLLQFLMSPTL
jgi:hypothetical protein